MSEQADKQTSSPVLPGERADSMLSAFLSNGSGARLAAASLKNGAEVAITFTDLPGVWRASFNDEGLFVLQSGEPVDPDFSLRIPPRAVAGICARPDADIGDLGIAFFEHILSREQELKIHVSVHSGFVKLTKRGWLGVVAKGGAKVMGWMAQKGLRGPGAIASALSRLKS